MMSNLVEINKQLKVYVVNQYDVANLAKTYLDWLNRNNIVTVYDMKVADIVLFLGGEDIDPSLYNETKGPNTYYNVMRDRFEILKFEQALSLNKFMMGICRGAQFLCAMSGGKLIQDVSGHTSSHNVIDVKTKLSYWMTSTHHQMMYPYEMPKDEYDILAYAAPDYANRRNFYGQDGKPYVTKDGITLNKYYYFVEPEIVWFPKTKCFAIQGHPESLEKNIPSLKWLNSLVLTHYTDLLTEDKSLSLTYAYN